MKKTGREKLQEKLNPSQSHIDDLDLASLLSDVEEEVLEEKSDDDLNEESPTIIVGPDDKKKELDKEEESDKEKIKSPYEEMVDAFKVFVNEHPMIKVIHLTFEEQKPGHYIVYQGQRSVVWVWLKPIGCNFIMRSLLRIILGLDKDHPLYKYFKNYSMGTGQELTNV